MPAITLPCHVSMFCGVPPDRHGVASNNWRPPVPPVPSLIDVVHRAGLGTAAFYGWEELRDLGRPGALDVAHYRRRTYPEQDSDGDIAAAAASYLVKHNPAFAFVYLGDVDAAGHLFGWMTPPYLSAAARADRAIGLVVRALRDSGRWADTACLVLADHGGHGLDHGADIEEDLAIPWIASGRGIRRGHMIAAMVSLVDTAPTILHLLGLDLPAEWTGKVVNEALTR